MLISINPFKTIKKIYSDDTVNKYKNSCYWENDPHIFALSEDVFKSLRETESSQCIIISGESGAGKTEVIEYFFKYKLIFNAWNVYF